jgi:membrane peptidoglycan carboxypeptidase
MPTKRRIVRRPAKPSYIVGPAKPGIKGFFQHLGALFVVFLLSFTTPRRFKAYWLTKAGALRVAKFAGAGALFIVAVFLWYAKDLPSPGKVNAKLGNTTTTFYARDAIDANGNVNFDKATKLYEVHGDKNRLVIPFDRIPTNVKNATIAIEDRNFYKHGSFSFIGIIRAAFIDLLHRSSRQGGSTITQQYVKNALLDPNQHSVSRKVKELILSVEIGQFYTKDQILSLYLNEIPYGNTSYGVEAACRTYFSEKYGNDNCAKNLNLSESALLAAALNAPSYYSPYGQHKDALIERQHLVLDLMADQKLVTRDEANKAKWSVKQITATDPARDINKVPSFYSAITAPNFVLTLQDQLEEKYGAAAVESSGWKVITTLDANVQKCAELSIYNPNNATCKPDGTHETTPNRNNANYKNLQASGGSNAAMVAADPNNGQVLAMVGSYSFAETQVNVATSLRQPGSSFKPYVYATLLSKNKAGCAIGSTTCDTYGAGSVLSDDVQNFGTEATPYKPTDFGGASEVGGPVTIRTALDASLNIPAVQALKLAGVSNSIATAKSMGISTLNQPAGNYGLSLVLGSGEVKLADHVNGYESFANGGVHYEQSYFLQIRDNKNSIVEDNSKPKTPKRVLDAQVAYLIANILSDDDARRFAFGNELQVPGHVGHSLQGQGVAVKTGTTEHFNDAWTMGFTPSIVAGVWAGNNDNAPMKRQAADIAAPFFRSFMGAVLASKPIETFSKADGLQYLPNAAVTRQKTSDSDYFPKWYKAVARKKVDIDKVSGKLATECTPKLAIESRDDPGLSATDDAHACDDIKPTVKITATPSGGGYSFEAVVTLGTFGTTKTSSFPAKLDITLDDQIISTQTISNSGTYSVKCDSACSATGSHNVKAVVTDSGFYQGQDDTTITVAGGGGTSTFQGSTDAATYAKGDTVTFTWTQDTGAVTYEVIVANQVVCTSTALSCSYKTQTVGIHQWFVRTQETADTTPIKTFKTTL